MKPTSKSNPFVDRKPRQAGRVSEAKVAKRIGARLVPASGAMPGVKADSQTDELLIESKSTKNGSIVLQLDWLGRLYHNAGMVGKVPALTLNFTDIGGKTRPDGAWALIPESLLRSLMARGKLRA